jgi:hypothetical protein
MEYQWGAIVDQTRTLFGGNAVRDCFGVFCWLTSALRAFLRTNIDALNVTNERPQFQHHSSAVVHDNQVYDLARQLFFVAALQSTIQRFYVCDNLRLSFQIIQMVLVFKLHWVPLMCGAEFVDMPDLINYNFLCHLGKFTSKQKRSFV